MDGDFYTDNLRWSTYSWLAPAEASIYVRPGGWLCAILVRRVDPGNDPVVKIELTEPNGALFADFTLSGYSDRGGLQLPEPIPNMDAAAPYELRCVQGAQLLQVITIDRVPVI
ncbi:MAG TPA: hypothetical protein VGG75_42595 [Trebonia sp.]|jgi:hypothetical protein